MIRVPVTALGFTPGLSFWPSSVLRLSVLNAVVILKQLPLNSMDEHTLVLWPMKAIGFTMLAAVKEKQTYTEKGFSNES